MDQEKMTKLIKENKWLLRQLIYLNNEIKELRGRVLKLEQYTSCEGVEIPVAIMSEKEIASIKIGGND